MGSTPWCDEVFWGAAVANNTQKKPVRMYLADQSFPPEPQLAADPPSQPPSFSNFFNIFCHFFVWASRPVSPVVHFTGEQVCPFLGWPHLPQR